MMMPMTIIAIKATAIENILSLILFLLIAGKKHQPKGKHTYNEADGESDTSNGCNLLKGHDNHLFFSFSSNIFLKNLDSLKFFFFLRVAYIALSIPAVLLRW